MSRIQTYWAYTLGSVAMVSAASLAGTITLVFGRRWLEQLLPFSVSFAAGALLGAAGAHLLPEAIEHLGTDRRLSGLFLSGLVGLFLLERVVEIVSSRGASQDGNHVHGLEHQAQVLHHKTGRRPGAALIANILLGGAIHNFIDGIAVAAAFGAGRKIGLATTIAVLLHEVPHHIGDVGVLIYGGLSARRAIILNMLATTSSIAGAIIVLVLGSRIAGWTSVFLPITAASFLYIATADLMPELQRETGIRRSSIQVLVLLAGVCLMFLLR